MRKRTQAREVAVQILYQVDVAKDPYEKALHNFWLAQDKEVEPAVKEFAHQLVAGTLKDREAIDAKLGEYANNWHLNRMAVVDRNILRLGCYELLYREDIPPKVTINEAVDLAKKYSGPDAGKFVNGILDKIKSEKRP